MKKNSKRIFIIIFILLLIGSGIFVYLKQSAANKKIVFSTLPAEQGRIVSTVVTTGKLQAVTTVEVGTQVSGRVQKLYVDFNSKVKKGDILAEIDPALFQAQYEESKASLDSSSASQVNYQAQYDNALMKVKSAQASTKTAEAQLEINRASYQTAKDSEVSAKANLAKALAQLENNRVEFDRSEQLFKKDFVSRSERDAAETKYKVSLADVDVARAGVQQASSSVKAAKLQLDSAAYNLDSVRIQEDSQRALARSAQAQVLQSQAQVRQSQERLEQAKVNLGYTVIYSPIDGIVTDRAVDVGQTVASSFQTPRLFQIAQNLKNMEVLADVDEADIGKVKDGLRVSFTVDAYPETKFRGKVKQVRSVATETQGVITYQVVISANNEDLKLMPGMTANITIISEVVDDCLKIPNAALRFKPENIDNFPYPQGSGIKKSEKTDKSDRKSGNGSERRKSGSGRGDKAGLAEKELLDDGRPRNAKPKESSVWVLKADGSVREEKVELGITGSSFTQMLNGSLKDGELLITGTESRKKGGSSASRQGAPGGQPMRMRI